MSQAFTAGDIVQLKSGGESMTVEEVNGNEVTCVWSESKKLQRQVFVAATLKPYQRPSVGFTVSRA
jgi:uncharacterized protein YodC (DUF2158 family)